jgi:predicted  nucleic acid-binding Zn-ribbon protein
MTTINLAKALKLKNRLAGRISKLDADIQAYNSVAEGKERLDVPALIEERSALIRRMVDLKVAISEANRPIQRAIFELAELKAQIDLLSKLNTQHGPAVEGFSGTVVQYTAQLRKGTVDREVRRLEGEIDRLQDRLDAFNHETTIAIDPALLDAEA